jgi:hypothetical protein
MSDRNEWDKNSDREQEFDRERGGHRLDYGRNREGRIYEANRWENEGGRYEGEREGRGNFPRHEDRSRDYQDDYRRERGDWSRGSRAADFGHRGDWGRQGSWGTYGNRPVMSAARNAAHTTARPEAMASLADNTAGRTAVSTKGNMAAAWVPIPAVSADLRNRDVMLGVARRIGNARTTALKRTSTSGSPNILKSTPPKSRSRRATARSPSAAQWKTGGSSVWWKI